MDTLNSLHLTVDVHTQCSKGASFERMIRVFDLESSDVFTTRSSRLPEHYEMAIKSALWSAEITHLFECETDDTWEFRWGNPGRLHIIVPAVEGFSTPDGEYHFHPELSEFLDFEAADLD